MSGGSLASGGRVGRGWKAEAFILATHHGFHMTKVLDDGPALRGRKQIPREPKAHEYAAAQEEFLSRREVGAAKNRTNRCGEVLEGTEERGFIHDERYPGRRTPIHLLSSLLIGAGPERSRRKWIGSLRENVVQIRFRRRAARSGPRGGSAAWARFAADRNAVQAARARCSEVRRESI